MTDATGSILDTPPSPVGSGLYLNFPHLGFYDSKNQRIKHML